MITIEIKDDAIAEALARVSAALTDMRPPATPRATGGRACRRWPTGSG